MAVPSGGRWLLRAGIDVRAGEGGPLTLLLLSSFCLFGASYAAKALRQSTFVDALGAVSLPYAYLLVAVLSYPFVVLYGRLARRLPWPRLVASSSALLAASFPLFFWLYGQGSGGQPGPAIALAFYLWITLAFGLAISQLWSSANRLFDARQAKRLFGLVAAGGSVGGIAGGQLARLVSEAAGSRGAILVPAVLLGGLLAASVALHRLRPAGEADAGAAPAGGPGTASGAVRGGLQTVLGSRHLRAVALVTALMVVVGQVVDLQFSWSVERATEDLAGRTASFANFYSLIALAALVLQLLFTSRLHRVMGLGFALRALPLTLAVGTGALMLAAGSFPGAVLAAACGLKLADGGLRHSIDQVTRELLFLPIGFGQRVQAKAFIDVAVQRVAKGLGAVVLLTVTLGLLSPPAVGWLSLALIVPWLWLTTVAQRQYVASYRAGLRSGTLDAETAIDLTDATTLEVLFQALGNPDGRQVLHTIDLLTAHGRTHLVPPVLALHDDPAVRRRTLELLAEAGRRDAAGLVEKLLADPDGQVANQALLTLAALQREEAVELMLPRLTSPQPAIRGAAVACLAERGGTATARAAAALEEMLSDEQAQVRIEAARCLGQLAEPLGREPLVRLLYDREPRVVRAAIGAARRRMERSGVVPEYVPVLVALMQQRRLKHDCREALTALGPPVVPILVHFMNDPDETLWVRRAVPKTLAAIGGHEAARRLVQSLGVADGFLRRKVIEALVSLRQQGVGMEFASREIAGGLRAAAQAYLQHLADLVACGLEGGRLEGPLVRWNRGASRPGLLAELLGERMRHRVEDLFGLLALLHPPADLRAARRGLLGERPEQRSRALEYLDGKLSGEERRIALALIGDEPPEERLRRAARAFGVAVESRIATLGRLIRGGQDAGVDGSTLAAAALQAATSAPAAGLRRAAAEVAATAADPFVRETAVWAQTRMEAAGRRPSVA